jgi:hypothetical protein
MGGGGGGRGSKYVDKRHGWTKFGYCAAVLGIAASLQLWYTIEVPAQLYSKSCRSAGIERKVLEKYWSCTGTAGAVLGKLELYWGS